MPDLQPHGKPMFAEILAQIGYDPATCALFNDVILPFPLMPHQLSGLHYGLFYPRFGLFFEPRTGKTIVMQLLAVFYARFAVRTIQIMPPGLFRQFLGDYAGIQGHGLRIRVLNDGPAAREKLFSRWMDQPESRPDVVLLSQPIFKAHWRELYLEGFHNLHFDESHQGLQDETNKISKAVREFADQNVKNRLVLSTGTPIPARIENVFGTVKLLTPEAYRSRLAFENAHVLKKPIMVPGSRSNNFAPRTLHVVSGYERLELLNQNLYRQALHASKRDVLNLEAPNIQIVPFALHPQHLTLYTKLLRERILLLEDEVLDARTTQKLRQVALQLVSCPEAYDPKVKKNALYETLQDLMDTLDVERNKVTVFANFTQSVEGIAHAFTNLNPVTVYGPNGANRNALSVERFRDDPDCRLLVANPVAGGVGFKLGDVCTTVIFAEPTASPGQFDQALSRVMLKGQTEPVVCYILKAEGTLAPLAIDSMIGRVRDINAVMQSKKTIFDALLNRLELTDEQRNAVSEQPIEEGEWIEEAA